MKITYKKKVYNVHWPKRFDDIILKVATRQRFSCYIKWKDAEVDGLLKGLPVLLSLRDFSQRYSYLVSRDDPKKVNRKKEQTKSYLKNKLKSKGTPPTTIQRTSLFSDVVPEEIKRENGWKPKTLWTEKQQGLLLKLVEKYRKSKVTIDWKKLVQNKSIKKFPYQDSFKLCKYYNSLKRKKKGGKKYVKKRRIEALRYKQENYIAYRDNQEKRRVCYIESVNEFLLSKLELR